MTLTDGLEKAKSIMFVTPSTPKEPPTIGIIFDDWAISTVCYETILDNFKDGDFKFLFEPIGVKLKVHFVYAEENSVQFSILLNYDENEFKEFTNKVNPDSHYVVVFGIMDKDSVLAMTPPVNKPISEVTFLQFDGYSLK